MLANNPDVSPREIAAGLASFDNEALLGHLEATLKAARTLEALKRREGNVDRAKPCAWLRLFWRTRAQRARNQVSQTTSESEDKGRGWR
jgi:hypothetical protein